MGRRTALFTIFLSLLGLLIGCARQVPAPLVYGTTATVTPKAAASSQPITAGIYRVAADETLYAIARRSGIALRELIDTNNLQPPYRLVRGQQLNIPNVRYHSVASGETLYAISRRYRVSPSALARINKVPPPYKIRPGQRLKLPASEAVIAVGTEANTAPKPRHKPDSGRPGANSSANSSVKPSAKFRAGKTIKPPPRRSSARFAWPVRGRVISRFGVKANGLHNDGINISVKLGTPVRAAENGVVVYAGNELRGFGNLLILRHEGGWVTAYGHNQTLDVKIGDVVRRGQRVARSGSTGNISRPQLHFEIRKNRRAVNPARYLTTKQAQAHFRIQNALSLKGRAIFPIT